MNRKAIKILFIVLATLLAAGIGVWIYFAVSGQPVAGRIAFGQKYYLTEVRPGVFTDVSINNESYFEIAPDQKTGLVYFKDADFTLNFIVTYYSEGISETKFGIEYIYKGANGIEQLFALNAVSGSDYIEFRSARDYRVDITKENPEDITTITYDSRIFLFTRGTV